MKTGKVSDTILGRSVFKLLGKRGNTVKPAYGQDAAHIINEGNVLAAVAAPENWQYTERLNNISAGGGSYR